MRRRIPGALLLAALLWSVSPSLLRASADTSLPGAPTDVSAQAGTLSATVQWTPADSNATSYTVTSNPRGITATVDGTSTSATVTGLAFATSYKFTVAGTNGIGTGPSSAPSNPVTPDAPGGPYHQGAARVLANTDVAAGASVTFNIGDDRVHAPGLSAVVLNVTASAATQASLLQLLVEGQVEATIPVAPGLVQSSLTVISTVGQMNPAVVQMTAGQAHVEIDFVGFFTGARTVRDDSGLLHMIPAARLFDASVAAGSSTDISVLNQGEVPATGVAGVLLNVTAINPTDAGSFALIPSGTVDPGTTALGFASGQTSANRAIVPLPTNGAVTLLDHGAAAEARIDVLGWFTDGTDMSAVGALFTPIQTTRLVDTSAAPGGIVTFPVWGQGGAPGGSVAAPATSAIVQVTVTSPGGTGSIVLSGTSIITFGSGQSATGTAIEQVKPIDGTGSLQLLGAAAHVTVDLVAFFSGDLIIPGSTKFLTKDQLAAITNLTATSITFAPGIQITPPIRLNDVINAGQSAATPDGLLRRVLSISTLGDGSTVLGTRTAKISEALTAFFLDWTLPPSPAAFGMSHGTSSRGVTAAPPALSTNPLPPPPNTSIEHPSPWPAFGPAVPPQGRLIDLASAGPGFGSGNEIDLRDLELQARINLSMSLSPSGTFKFQIAFSAGARASIDIQLLGQISPIVLTLFPLTLDITPEPVFIRISPFFFIEFQPAIDLSLTFRVSITGGIVIHLALDRYVAVDGGFDGSKFFSDPITEHNYLAPAQEFNWRPAEQLQIELDVHVKPGLHFYGGLAILAVDAYPFGRFTVDPTAPHWWDITTGFCAALEFALNDLFTTGDFETPANCHTSLIAEAPGHLLGITITPSPAKVARSATQHFHADIPLSINGVIWSINETGGGSLSNVTQFDVDYTAPRTAGTYHLRAEAVDDPTSAKEVVITVPADPPTAPINVVAALTTSNSAIVGWTVPADDGGAPLKTYVVTASPGGAIATINAPGTTATFNTLTPVTTYTFSVAAINGAGLTGASGVSNSITTPPAGPMTVSTTSLDFGSVTLGQSSQPQTVVVTAGGAQLVISTVTIGGAAPREFALQNDLCSGQTLQPGASCSFAIVYRPTQQIPVAATVSINDSDSTSPQLVALTGTSPVPAVAGVIPVFDIDMVDAQTGYALESRSGGTEIVKTTDGGTTWHRLIQPAGVQFNSSDASAYNMRFLDASHGFISAYRQLVPAGRVSIILSTSDGGVTWQQISVPAGAAVGSIWFTDASHGWFIGGVSGPPAPPGSLVNSVLAAVYATTDGGATWTRQTLSDPIINATPGCIGLEGNLSMSFTDALHGWISSAVLCDAPNTTTLSRGSLFWSTSDGGNTWAPHQAPVDNIFDRIQVTGVSQIRELGVVNVTSTAAQRVLVSSDDGGATFSVTSLSAQNVQIPAVTFTDGTHGVVLISDGHIWRTADGGSTWTSSTLPRFASSAGKITSYGYVAIASPDGTNIWVAGSVGYGLTPAGFIEKSSDGGTTWTVQALGDGT